MLVGLVCAAGVTGCETRPPTSVGSGEGEGGGVIGTFSGGTVTRDEMAREKARLPPVLRERSDSEAGERDFVLALIDRKLLAQEGRRLHLDEEPAIRRELDALRDRLVIQALLEREQKQTPAPTAEEQRAWFDAHRSELETPESARVRRVFAAVGGSGTPDERRRARRRAEAFLSRLQHGEPVLKVARSGEGPEATHDGDFGTLSRASTVDPALVRAALAIGHPGEASPVVEGGDGFSVLVLVEHQPARLPSFEEVQSTVLNRLSSERQRSLYDRLVARLRAEAKPMVSVSP